jgi:hypothetical protein
MTWARHGTRLTLFLIRSRLIRFLIALLTVSVRVLLFNALLVVTVRIRLERLNFSKRTTVILLRS